MSDKPTHEERLFSSLAYPFWYVMFPVFLISPDRQASPYVRFHAYQSLVLGLSLWASGIAIWNLSAFFGRFILVGLLLYPLLRLGEWAALLLTLYGAARAWLGSRFELPFITEFCRPFVEQRDRPSCP